MSRASKYLRKKLAEGGLLDPEALKNLAAANPPKPGTGVAGPEKAELTQNNAANQDAVTSKLNPPTAQPQQMSLKATPAQQSTSQPQKAASPTGSAPSVNDYDNADDYYTAFAEHYINTTGDYALNNLPSDVKQQWEDAQGDSPDLTAQGNSEGVVATSSSSAPTFNNGDPRPTADDYPSYGAFRTALAAWEAAQGPESPNYGGPGFAEEPEYPAYDPDDFENAVDFKPTGTEMPAFQGPFGSPGEGGQAAKSFTDYYDMDGDGKVSKLERDYQRTVIRGTQIDHEAPLQFQQRPGKPDRNKSQFENMTDAEFNAAYDDWETRNNEYQDYQEDMYDFVRTWHDRGGAEEGNTNNQIDNPTGDGTSGGGNNNNDSDGNDDMANTGDKGLPDGKGNEGNVDESGANVTVKSGRDSEAPTDIEITGPDVTAPTVAVDTVSKENTITPVSKTQKLNDSAEITRTEDDTVTAESVTAAQTTAKPVRQDYESQHQFEAALADYKSKTEVSKPTDVTASSMEATTIGVPPPKPLRKDFIGKGGTPAFEEALAQHETELEEFYKTSAMRPVNTAQGSIEEDSKAIAAQEDATLSEGAKATAATRDTLAEEAAKAGEVEYSSSEGAYVNTVTGKVATVEETKEAEAKEREAIVGEPATGEAAEIMSMYDYNQSQKRAIQGADAKKKAVKKLKAAGLSDDAIANRLADEPDLIADEMEDLPEDVRTTLSGLPKEALIDVQMESLMSGMEDGEVPAWARPALAKVEANLARRGMSASSVGRDALFNAVIQSAIPMAQANASAIQSATAQDKQIAADFLAKNAGFQQQMNLANLSNDQQMRLANLSAQNQAASENLSNAQQTELANLNTRMQTNLLQGKIAAEMNVAQLNVDQQRAVVNAQTNAGIDLAKFNAAQQVELTNSKFMQNMTASKFSADQQAALQTATAMASMDMANLDKNTKLAVTNAQSFLQMDMANLSNRQQSAVLTAQQNQQALLSNQSAQNAAAQFNASSQQQADQFMANLGVQIEQYNVSANTAREQFNATEKNRIAALNAGNKLQADQFEQQLETDIAKFNEQQDFQRDQWNAANAQAVEQSNIQWRRQSNLADTAAQNAANQQNAQISYNLTSQELTQVWQQLRDAAAYTRQSFENEEQRKAQLLATAIGNEKIAAKDANDANTWLTTVIK